MKEAREQHSGLRVSRRERMQEPEAVAQMLALARLGWGTKRIAQELGVARNTVKRYVAAGRYVPYRSPAREGKLAGLGAWLQAQFAQHRGNCDVVRQELQRQQGVLVSLRTVERACRGYRAEWAAQARATVRFETAPGQQLQIDFGSATVEIDGARQKVHVFVATLGYSRLGYVAAFGHERQAAWLAGLEGAFAHFGGIPREVLLDNARALVLAHDVQTREVTFNERLLAFARHWGFTPKACAPFRPQTKGKDESANRFLNRLLAYGGEFTGWGGLAEAVARVEAQANSEPNRTTGLPPDALFMREKESLRPIGNLRLLESMVGDVSVQTVPPTMLVRAAGREWSVPRRCIGRRVSVIAMPGGQVVVRMAGEEVAVHDAASGPSRPINYDPDHYGQALEGKRGLADADIAEAARANLALLDSLGGA